MTISLFLSLLGLSSSVSAKKLRCEVHELTPSVLNGFLYRHFRLPRSLDKSFKLISPYVSIYQTIFEDGRKLKVVKQVFGKRCGMETFSKRVSLINRLANQEDFPYKLHCIRHRSTAYFAFADLQVYKSLVIELMRRKTETDHLRLVESVANHMRRYHKLGYVGLNESLHTLRLCEADSSQLAMPSIESFFPPGAKALVSQEVSLFSSLTGGKNQICRKERKHQHVFYACRAELRMNFLIAVEIIREMEILVNESNKFAETLEAALRRTRWDRIPLPHAWDRLMALISTHSAPFGDKGSLPVTSEKPPVGSPKTSQGSNQS